MSGEARLARAMGVAGGDTDARCLICGCTDSYGCEDGCEWVIVDRAKKVGVCSSARCVRLALRRLSSRSRRRR